MLSIWANKSYVHLSRRNYKPAYVMAENILKSDPTTTPPGFKTLATMYAAEAQMHLGMISHKKPLITIFGHKHNIKNFIKKFHIFH